jgi:hypothetical protein
MAMWGAEAAAEEGAVVEEAEEAEVERLEEEGFGTGAEGASWE